MGWSRQLKNSLIMHFVRLKKSCKAEVTKLVGSVPNQMGQEEAFFLPAPPIVRCAGFLSNGDKRRLEKERAI